MLMWFASGIVMMYVDFPRTTESERLRTLPVVSFQECCRFTEAIPDEEPIFQAQVESLLGVPTLRVRRAGKPDMLVDLTTGSPVRIDMANAETVARATVSRILGQPAAPVESEDIRNDQWTVGHYMRDRPFFKY